MHVPAAQPPPCLVQPRRDGLCVARLRRSLPFGRFVWAAAAPLAWAGSTHALQLLLYILQLPLQPAGAGLSVAQDLRAAVQQRAPRPAHLAARQRPRRPSALPSASAPLRPPLAALLRLSAAAPPPAAPPVGAEAEAAVLAAATEEAER